jgi:hypothetical protein
MKRGIVTLILAALLAGGISLASPRAVQANDFNDRYVYIMTRGVNDMDAHPVLKATLFPVTIALDTGFLPFAVIAGFVTG